MGMHQPDSHRIFDPQRGRMVDKNLYYSGGGSAPMPYTPRIDPYASQKGNQSSQSHLERLPSAGSSIGTTTWEEFEAEERRFAEWTREQRDARHDSQPRYSYGQGPSAQAYHPTITHSNDGQALSQNYGAAHMNPVAVPQGYYQPPAIQYWRSSSGEIWGNAGAGWYRVQGHHLHPFSTQSCLYSHSTGNPAIPRVDLDNRLRPKMPVGKCWARRGRFPASGSPGNDRFFCLSAKESDRNLTPRKVRRLFRGQSHRGVRATELVDATAEWKAKALAMLRGVVLVKGKQKAKQSIPTFIPNPESRRPWVKIAACHEVLAAIIPKSDRVATVLSQF
ncbi:hypothetical protein DFH07DRAFT_774455 [Mycena maculata]|uniref:Uncharacterized protein n=1 Tax=Mycena maculata TaxID=230809 RepID=A0AAD7NAG4_9AGAR|nr:hypothetical protein DFH07DRAFT_774455 [Mycena maculata]